MKTTSRLIVVCTGIICISIACAGMFRPGSKPVPGKVTPPKTKYLSLDEVSYSFTKEPFVSPEIIKMLHSTQPDMWGQPLAFDLSGYGGPASLPFKKPVPIPVEISPGLNPLVLMADNGDGNSFSYRLVGTTASGIQVLHVIREDGTDSFSSILLVAFAREDGQISGDVWASRIERGAGTILLKRLGQMDHYFDPHNAGVRGEKITFYSDDTFPKKVNRMSTGKAGILREAMAIVSVFSESAGFPVFKSIFEGNEASRKKDIVLELPDEYETIKK